MDIKHVKTFVVFSEEGSYHKAAQKLNYAPSTLSEHIRLLESELQVKLVVTSGRNSQLTEAGKAFLPFAKAMLNIHQDAFTGLSPYRDLTGNLQVVTTETIVLYHLRHLFMRFAREVPQIHLTIRVNTSNYFSKLLLDGDADVAFWHLFEPLKSDNLCFVPLYVMPLVLVTHPAHPLVAKSMVTAQELRHYRLIFPEKTFLTSVDDALGLSTHNVDLNENLILNSSSLVKRILKEEHAVSVLPYDVVQEEIESGTLVTLPTSIMLPTMTACAVYKRQSLKIPLIKCLISFIKDALEQAP